MQIKEILNFIHEHYIVTGVLLTSLVQISPIEINPISWLIKQLQKLLGWVGKQMMNEVMGRLDSLEQEIKSIQKENDDIRTENDLRRIKDLRKDILDFAKELPIVEHHKEDFDRIYDAHDEYEQLLDKHNMTNGKVTRAMKKIDSYYDKLSDDIDF